MEVQERRKNLLRLQELIGCSSFDTVEVKNNVLIPSRTTWTIFQSDGHSIGSIEARFGGEYPDEPDGYVAWLEGHNPTDYCKTVEECAEQLKERKYAVPKFRK